MGQARLLYNVLFDLFAESPPLFIYVGSGDWVRQQRGS